MFIFVFPERKLWREILVVKIKMLIKIYIGPFQNRVFGKADSP